MDNAIRTALDAWLPLIKELSFDERVGFLAGRLTFAPINTLGNSEDLVINATKIHVLPANAHLIARSFLLTRQNEQLKALDNRREPPTPSAQIKTQTVKVVKPHATREQLIAAIDKAVKRVGYGDKNAAKDIQRYARQLERIENV